MTRLGDLSPSTSPVHQNNKRNRRSVYWADSLPLLPSNGREKKGLTPRLEELGRPKQRMDNTQCHYRSPMWPVNERVLNYMASPRIHELARQKTLPEDYVLPRSVPTRVPDSALRASSSSRLTKLAKPKDFAALPIVSPRRWDWTDWEHRISPSALKANSTPRVEELAKPKSCPASFQGAKSAMWPVSVKTKNATASEKLCNLSRPRGRTMIVDHYDPYYISKATLGFTMTSRLTELSEPRRTITK